MSTPKRAHTDLASPSVVQIMNMVKNIVGSEESMSYKDAKAVFDVIEASSMDELAKELKSLTAFVGFSPEETWAEFTRVLNNFNTDPARKLKGYTTEALALIILIVLIHRGTNPQTIIGRCGPGLNEILKDLVTMGFKKNIPQGGNKQKALIFSRIAACQPVLSNLVVQHFGLSSLGESAREGISPRFASPALYSALPVLNLTFPTAEGVAATVATLFAVCYQTNFSRILSGLAGAKSQNNATPQSVFIRNAINSTALSPTERSLFFSKRMCKTNPRESQDVIITWKKNGKEFKLSSKPFVAPDDAVEDFLAATGMKGIRIGDFGISTNTPGRKAVFLEYSDKTLGVDVHGNLIIDGESEEVGIADMEP